MNSAEALNWCSQYSSLSNDVTKVNSASRDCTLKSHVLALTHQWCLITAIMNQDKLIYLTKDGPNMEVARKTCLAKVQILMRSRAVVLSVT